MQNLEGAPVVSKSNYIWQSTWTVVKDKNMFHLTYYLFDNILLHYSDTFKSCNFTMGEWECFLNGTI